MLHAQFRIRQDQGQSKKRSLILSANGRKIKSEKMFTSIAMQCDSASNLKINLTIWHMNKVRQMVFFLM